jgi:hypothetical protein
MKNPVMFICVKSQIKMNVIMDKMDEKDTTIDRDRLHTELIILDWIYFKLASM